MPARAIAQKPSDSTYFMIGDHVGASGMRLGSAVTTAAVVRFVTAGDEAGNKN
jgi:hypothetical protein